MSYRVFARKYRSQTFDELVGQDALATTLKNAVASGRVHHGYLFTGTRGVGKTSMARILAKALNCQSVDEPTPTPCGECDSCRQIAEGEDIDVIEIDAASNTGVDNIRELRGNAVYRPARSRFKIYIIDEVHMLSTGAFNALLKTLEEPPPHVKFIMATTEAHKIPATIQSRCQRFDFRAIDPQAIAAHLGRILEQENVEADQDVIRRISRLARGSMRDALSLLDQLLSFAGDRLSAEIADDILPVAHDETICDLVDRLADGDAAEALVCVERSLDGGHTPERFCEALIEHVRTLMLLLIGGPDTNLVDVPSQARERLIEQCRKFDAPTYVYMITLCEELRRAVKTSGAARCLLDAAMVRLAMTECFSDVRALMARLTQGAADSTAVASGTAPPGGKTPGSLSPPTRSAAPADSTSTAALPRPEPTPRGRAVAPPPTAGSAQAASPPVSSKDKQEALESPVVRAAISLFEGRPINMRYAADDSTKEVEGQDAEPSEPLA